MRNNTTCCTKKSTSIPDDAIERNNKIYIPFSLDESVLLNKARVILKNGTVIHLDKKDIKEDVDQEKGMKYNYFAVNGLERSRDRKTLCASRKPGIHGKHHQNAG